MGFRDRLDCLIGEERFACQNTGAIPADIVLLLSHAEWLALLVMVAALTYVSLIVGELVPKRLALTAPERIASIVARPMEMLAAAGRPLVVVLSASTDGLLRLLRVRRAPEPAVSLEEIKVLMQQGTEEGVFEESEQQMVSNVLGLDERRVGGILTPRADVVFLDVTRPFDDQRKVLAEAPHSIVPVCRGSLDDVIGFVRSKDVLARLVRDEAVDFPQLAFPALYVPATITLMRLLQHFRQAHVPVALAINEHGTVEGLVSLTDVAAAIVGELRETASENRQWSAGRTAVCCSTDRSRGRTPSAPSAPGRSLLMASTTRPWPAL